jgi:hypothetical protein
MKCRCAAAWKSARDLARLTGVYRALVTADAMAKRLPPRGFTGKVHQIKAEVGGTYKMSFTNLTTGNTRTAPGARRPGTTRRAAISRAA